MFCTKSEAVVRAPSSSATNRRPLLSHGRGDLRWRRKKTHSVEMSSGGNRGVTQREAMQHHKTSEKSEREREREREGLEKAMSLDYDDAIW